MSRQLFLSNFSDGHFFDMKIKEICFRAKNTPRKINGCPTNGREKTNSTNCNAISFIIFILVWCTSLLITQPGSTMTRAKNEAMKKNAKFGVRFHNMRFTFTINANNTRERAEKEKKIMKTADTND